MKRRKAPEYPGRILYSFFMKCVMYLVMMTAVGVSIFSLLAGMCCRRLDEYRGSEEYQEGLLQFHAWQQARELLRLYLSQGMEQVEDFAEREDVRYAIYKISGRRIGGNYKDEDVEQILRLGTMTLQYEFQFSENIMEGLENMMENAELYRVHIAYLEDAQIQAVKPYLQGVPEQLPMWMKRFWYAAGIAMLTAVVSLGYLLGVSGHHPGSRTPRAGWPARAPMERLLLWWAAAVPVGLWYQEHSQSWSITIVWTENIESNLALLRQSIRGMTLYGLLLGFLATGFLLHLSLYVKSDRWWEQSLIWKVMQAPGRLLMQLSWFKKILLTALVVCGLEAAGIGLAQYKMMAGNGTEGQKAWLAGYGIRIIWGLWVLGKGILMYQVLRTVDSVGKLRNSGKQLAEGNLGYQIPLDGMKGELRQFGQDMNAISQVVAAAVEDRLKSEHLKTELITNVSHDIKTPLTSIINYADLIGREHTDNEKITEYAQVLHRQSARLKKLIEDLMEASKASTGNMEVHLERCQAGVLLNQAMGEFEERLQEREIDLVVKQGQEPVWIMADPRMLWRILDNLMNNICKYAQSNTRVYLSMEVHKGQAMLIFKNISQYPLDIDASELMERFVRGDRSRHTEGSGLGLSIARSLTELQGGQMELTVDGDLFKVTLVFPVAEEQ